MTVVTLFILSRVNLTSGPAEHLITFILSLALLGTAVALVFRTRLVDYYSKRVGELSPRSTAVLTIITGGILGILVSISSVGAGAIGVTVLMLLYPKLGIHRIVGHVPDAPEHPDVAFLQKLVDARGPRAEREFPR